MRLDTLRIDGFGRLAGRTFAFAPGLTVVVGPNEAGKSTLSAAIVAALYGLQRGEKDRWRPWTGSAYGAVLHYQTADGKRWELHRDFERDAKGVRLYDEDGNDAAGRAAVLRSLVPGELHLRVPLDVYLQTACVRQRAIALEGSSAGAVSTALAQALDGGPKEDAAMGALERLDAALRKHVGTQRAHKNAPLRALRAEEERRRREADDARAALASLAELRERIAAERAERDRAAAAAAGLERRARELQAAQLRAQLAALKDYRDELAELQAARAAYDDVATFPVARVGELEDAYHAWRSAVHVAEAASRALAEEPFGDDDLRELAALGHDAGSLDDDAYDAVRAAAAQAETAASRAAAASGDAAAARRDGGGGRTASGMLVAVALTAFAGDVAVAIAHLWIWTALASVAAIVFGFAAARGSRARAGRAAEADAKQRIADAATAEERLAADTVARVLEPLKIASIDELARRRERYVALHARAALRAKADARARSAEADAAAAAERFDRLAALLVPDVAGTRDERRAASGKREARCRERDGIDAALAMLTVRRGTILLGADEFALQAEYEALVAAGVEPAEHDEPATLREIERERAELIARAHDAERRMEGHAGELRRAEQNVPDAAAADEALASTQAQIVKLEAFERALKLARDTVEQRKDEAHRAFARRLEQYSTDVLAAITGGRYGEIRLDPSTLEIRVRIPETGQIEDLDRLSAGTSDQIALVVRFATARMFAEGLERPPLLLDDPFAFWDADRIARCLPVLVRGGRDGQTIVFTASGELAEAAAAAGASRIDLAANGVLV